MESRYYRHWHLAKDETELNITELEYSVKIGRAHV